MRASARSIGCGRYTPSIVLRQARRDHSFHVERIQISPPTLLERARIVKYLEARGTRCLCRHYSASKRSAIRPRRLAITRGGRTTLPFRFLPVGAVRGAVSVKRTPGSRRRGHKRAHDKARATVVRGNNASRRLVAK